jgi:hypothetical protein
LQVLIFVLDWSVASFAERRRILLNNHPIYADYINTIKDEVLNVLPFSIYEKVFHEPLTAAFGMTPKNL